MLLGIFIPFPVLSFTEFLGMLFKILESDVHRPLGSVLVMMMK